MAKRSKPKAELDHANPARPTSIRFYYVKSAQFRTIHVDGVHGGLTPQGRIQAALFSERFPIPQQTVHPLKEGELQPEIKEERVAKDGVVREVEVNLIMDPKQARGIAQWLEDKAREFEKITSPKDGQGSVSAANKAKKTPKKTRKVKR